MSCSKCGAELAEDAKTCAKCGATVEEPKVETTAPEVGAQQRLSFVAAVRKFLTTYTSAGRASRSEYWWSLLFSVILLLGVEAIFGEESIVAKATLLYVRLMGLLIGWRRIHDIGKSGWWFLVPAYNIWLLTRPSQMEENKFGKVPNTEPAETNIRWARAIWIATGICIAAFLIDGISSDESEGGEGATGGSEVKAMAKGAAKLNLKKAKDSDALWYEGTNTTIVYLNGDWDSLINETIKDVEPNTLEKPKWLRNIGTNPQKGEKYYFSKENYSRLGRIVFVDDGYVIVAIDDAEYYIATDDEYVDGDYLNSGVYIYTGRRKMKLANGSSTMLHAFKKMPNGYEAYEKAMAYNEIAKKAADEENSRRREAARTRLKANEAEEVRNIRNKVIKELNPYFMAKVKSALKEKFPENQVHISPIVKDKVDVQIFKYLDRYKVEEYQAKGCELYFGLDVPTTDKELDFWIKDAYRKLNNGKSPEELVEDIFSRVDTRLIVIGKEGFDKFVAYVGFRNSGDSLRSGFRYSHDKLKYGIELRDDKEHVYILDTEADRDICVNNVALDGYHIFDRFKQAYRDKYEPGAKIPGLDE